jgi:hypothetical protein
LNFLLLLPPSPAEPCRLVLQLNDGRTFFIGAVHETGWFSKDSSLPFLNPLFRPVRVSKLERP